MEVVTLVSLREGRGVGRALLDAARRRAEAAGCRRLWLVTTDNNLRALALYATASRDRRWGLRLVAFHRHGVARSRLVKPAIPERDQHGVPISHELELALDLGA
jgi:ribosomal protein S18 acetylase RimI-like enzyme